jgi:hypothetical protein
MRALAEVPGIGEQVMSRELLIGLGVGWLLACY